MNPIAKAWVLQFAASGYTKYEVLSKQRTKDEIRNYELSLLNTLE